MTVTFDETILTSEDMFNHASSQLTLDSDDSHSSSDEYTINFSKLSSQDFGLGYWINHTNNRPQSPLPCHSSDRSVFISKSNSVKSNDVSLSSSYQKPKRYKKIDSVSKSNQKSTKIKYKNYDIPRLKIPKQVIKNYLKTLSPNDSMSQSSSSESESSFHSPQMNKSTKRSKLKSRSRNHDSECKSNSSSNNKDSSCLEKSFEKLNYCNKESQSQLSAASHDIMCMTLTVDHNIATEFSSRGSQEISSIILTKHDNVSEQKHAGKLTSHDSICSSSKNNVTSFLAESNSDSLSNICDIPYEENNSVFDESQQQSLQSDGIYQRINKTPTINNRKRSLSSLSDDDDGDDRIVTAKRQHIQACSTTDSTQNKESEDKHGDDLTPVEFIKFLTNRLNTFENLIFEKYCLSQPNAMKFLANNHAANWESHINSKNQMHLVPCEFLNEIFHRALHCFGFEKKIVKESMRGNCSPITKYSSLHSMEYKKLRDEYSLGLKRVSYGMGVIDEFFRRKVNYQNIKPNNDVLIVRKWKHIIYYLCLHAKSAFMAKEIQYQYYDQFQPVCFDGAMDTCANKTPSVTCLSITTQEMYNKPQLSKESSKLFLHQKLSDEHCSHSDLEVSPHSYDSGKGSSIRMSSSNANSLVSVCHTTSSLNSTPHSNIINHESQLHLPGYQLFRITEYQTIANEHLRILPEATQLHNRIISKIGTEPNANGHENVLKLIYYLDIVLTLSRDDRMNECLEKLLHHAD